MKKPTEAELKETLAAHLKWLRGEKDGARADLSRADLSRAYLSGADLSRADLSRADLSGAYLSRADLSRAYLSRANLSRAYLSGAYLSGADLSGAYLSGAYLSRADLSGAYLSRANLSGANLSGAKIDNEALKALRPVFWIIPEVGAFRCFKKLANGIIAELEVPAEARRTCNLKNPRKFRVEYVDVISLHDGNGNAVESGVSMHKSQQDRKPLTYIVGERAVPDGFDDSVFEDCSHGIHAFLTRQEAEAWSL